MKYYRFIYRTGMLCSRKTLTTRYGEAFWQSFAQRSARWLDAVIAETPDIGNTIFAFNYAFTPAYIAWYKAAQELGLDKNQTDRLLWTLNEGIITLVPRWAGSLYMSSYLKSFRKKAPEHERLCQAGHVHPYDYKLRYISIDDKTFGIDITECGMLKLARDFDAEGIFPAVCRVDYIMSQYMGAGFARTKTLGDGDDCCDCRYTIGGTCTWQPGDGKK